jgi:hypothetical protein
MTIERSWWQRAHTDEFKQKLLKLPDHEVGALVLEIRAAMLVTKAATERQGEADWMARTRQALVYIGEKELLTQAELRRRNHFFEEKVLDIIECIEGGQLQKATTMLKTMVEDAVE